MKTMDNPKVEQLVRTARELFVRYGMRRVSIEEICGTAGVSKMTFYKYFRNKSDLAKHLIGQIISENMAKYRGIMGEDIPFSEKVERTVRMKLDQTKDLSQEFFDEMVQSPDPDISDFLARKRQEAFHEVVTDYVRAQREGSIRRDIKPEFILYFFNHMVEMLKDDRLVKLYHSPRALTVELTKFFFYGILPREGSKGDRDGV